MNRRYFIAGVTAAFAVGIYSNLATAQKANSASLQANANKVSPLSERVSRILVLGDSLSAEYGLRRGSGWVALLDKRLATDGTKAHVINASISGDTTSGGRSRLSALIAQNKPTVVVIELGANDALRGLPLSMTEDNLSKMIQLAQKSGAKVLVIGMQMPPNYGADYGNRFAALFEKVARLNKAALVPFLLKGVADSADSAQLFQNDGLHPKEQAHPTILANVLPELRSLLN